jgi:L-idonate 5-dehydrogenase
MSVMMLGAVLHGAKDLRLESLPQPDLLPGQVLLRVRQAGICGSDLHYYQHGYCAAFVPTRPFVLGHELIADVLALGTDVTAPAVGARVVVNPARHCGFCGYCQSGRGNLCRQTIMLGSASTKPPTDGAFAQFVAVRAEQCYEAPVTLDDGLGALIEPLAVALHAVKRAGIVSGKAVLVAGGGPIGLLVALTSRAAGAMPVVVSDIVAERRETALKLGVDAVLDPASPALAAEVRSLAGEGFDVIFEASGAARALRQVFDLVRPGATIVQLGTLGTQDVPLPANQLMVHEIQFVGSFRYGNVFEEAIRLAASGRLNLQPLISQVLPLSRISEAMELAASKANVLKVQIKIPQ